MITPSLDLVFQLESGYEPANFYWKIPKGDARITRLKLMIAGQLIDLTDHVITLTGKRSIYDPTPVFEVAGALDTVPTSALVELVTGLVKPVNTAFVLGTGSLPAGTYYYRVTAFDVIGETLASPETSFVIGIGDEPAGVQVNWTAVAGAVGYDIYGRSTSNEYYLASVLAPIVTWLDDGTLIPTHNLPTVDTSQIEAGRYLAALTIERPTEGRCTLIGTVEIEAHA